MCTLTSTAHVQWYEIVWSVTFDNQHTLTHIYICTTIYCLWASSKEILPQPFPVHLHFKHFGSQHVVSFVFSFSLIHIHTPVAPWKSIINSVIVIIAYFNTFSFLLQMLLQNSLLFVKLTKRSTSVAFYYTVILIFSLNSHRSVN